MIYDAVIIGSGLGGLSCAAYLAKRKWKVVVLEKHSSPGGYAASFTRGDFTFDVGLHMVDGVGKDETLYPILEQCGVADKVEFIRLKDFARLVFPEHDIRIPGNGLEGVMAEFEKNFPHEQQGIRSLFRQMTKIYDDQVRFCKSKVPFLLQLPFFPFLYRAFFPVVNKTAAKLMDKHIGDEKLKSLLFADWFYYGLPPSMLNISYGVMPNMDYWTKGAYYVKGGNRALPYAFVDVIRQNGGEIVYNSRVVTIMTENGKAIGAVTEQGKSYKGRTIISNASPHDTFFNMAGRDKLPAKLVTRTENLEPSLSYFVVYLGLNAGFAAQFDNRSDYEIMISDTYDHDQDYQWRVNCEADKAGFHISLNSNIEKDIAKNNKFVMSISQPQGYGPWKKYENAYLSNDKAEYIREKKRIADILIKRAEKVISNISKHIEVIEIATPLTLRRYTGNPNGACYGWANTVKQSNPLQRSPQKTPINNLYLSSAWTFPGMGQMGVVLCGWRLGRRLAG